jgi:uncharacterized membrane protein YccC
MSLYSKSEALIAHAKKLPQSIRSPATRYRHAQFLHSIRVALAVLTSIALTSGINIPHGVWATISLLVVIGGLQHQGNIRKKSAERALGTMFGAVLGLAWIAQYAVIGSLPLTYALLSISTGICAYYAIGKGGYIALLTAITMCIVAGHGDNTIEIGLWRTANVMIGITIALVFSFALPLYATYLWRYQLAKNMRGIASICKHLMTHASMTPQEQISYFSAPGRRLIDLRSLMPSVSKETEVPLRALEAIQKQHRTILSALEMVASASHSTDGADNAKPNAMLQIKGNEIRKNSLEMARSLRSGKIGYMTHTAPDKFTSADPSSLSPAIELQGLYWVVQQIVEQTENLKKMLIELEKENLFFHKQNR